ncbi:MAG: M48 family metallopeptidase [Gammaproteobacteria bacterium]|nr:M48 family metallopeptidase [Gammaproteobacteria bacterium]
MNPFTLLFLAALALGLALRLWLLQRHRRHVELNRNQVPAAFRERITPAQHQKAAAYTLSKTGLHRLELVWQTVPLLLLTLGGGIGLLDAFWSGLLASPLPAGVALVLSVFLLLAVVELPFSIWRTFVLEARFGFNRTTPLRFVQDLMLQSLLLAALGTPLLWAILWLMQEAGQFWWLAAWLVWIGFTLTVTWLYPTLIAPLFNRFTPLQEGELKNRVQLLLERCGFTSSGIFVMDGSKRSGHGNAYFTGFGKRKRIVFFDTLIDTLEQEEMEAVLAHELGHFRHRHVGKQLALSALLVLVGMAVLGWLSGESWFYRGLGVHRESGALALLLFLLAVPVFTQFLNPLVTLLSRRFEFQADEFACRQTGAEPLISALVKLYRENASTLTPDPLYSAFHDSHPPAPVRVAHLSSID